MFVTVPGSETNALIGDLSPSDAYQVFVSAATSAGFGESSSNLVIAESKLQLSAVLSLTIAFHHMQFSVMRLICVQTCVCHAKV